MQEFSSISVSSYDAASLADKLTQKSADGWDVVAIVPAGTNVTAYLSREAGDDTSSGESVATEAPAFSLGSDTAAEVAPAEPAPEPEPAAAEPAAAEPAVAEPAGWAVAPEPTPQPTLPGSSDTAWAPTGATEPVVVPEAAQPAPQPEPEPEPEPEPVTTTAAAATAPAGWYADPANRYELRYWDGAQWTEHVSRAGQQFTDPPVA